MTMLIVDLPVPVYEQIATLAQQHNTTMELVVQHWLAERVAIEQARSERDQLRAVLQAAGRLAELSPAEYARAAQSTLTLEEARTILDRSHGKPLSEVILDMRGPKE